MTSPKAVNSGQTEREAWDVALDALDDYQRNWDTGLPAEYASGERIAMECAVEAVREALNEARAASSATATGEREIWEYSFIHSSALGRPDEKVTLLTYDKDTAFKSTCFDQKLVCSAGVAIAEVCQDADGFKHIAEIVEELDDIPTGTRLYAYSVAAQSPAPASPSGEDAAEQSAAPMGLSDELIDALAREHRIYVTKNAETIFHSNNTLKKIRAFARDLLVSGYAYKATVPPDVMAALDRMCTPLDKSVLNGATADADAYSMKLIRDYILRTATPREDVPALGVHMERLESLAKHFEVGGQTLIGAGMSASYAESLRAILATEQSAAPMAASPQAPAVDGAEVVAWVYCDTLHAEHCHLSDQDAIEDGWLPLVYARHAGLARSDIQERAINHGFKYWRASDAHGVTASIAEAEALLANLLGVEVEIGGSPAAASPAAESKTTGA